MIKPDVQFRIIGRNGGISLLAEPENPAEHEAIIDFPKIAFRIAHNNSLVAIKIRITSNRAELIQ